MRLNGKTIALVEWHWMGHHPMYAVHLACALAHSGATVLPLCNQPEDFSRRLREIQNHADPVDGLRWIERILEPQPVHLVPLGHGAPERLDGLRRSIRHFGIIGKQLRRWQWQHHRTIDTVLFAWIYDTEFRYFRYAQLMFGFPWVGLYFNSRYFRLPGTRIPYDRSFSCPERFVSLPSCKGIAVADPWIVDSIKSLAGPGKRVVVFPDFTDTSHEADSGLARKIRAMAGQHRIVSLVGHLQRTKGLVEFTAALQRPELCDAFFFLGGEIYWGEIDSSTHEHLLRSWEAAPNLYCHLQYLSSEACLNSVIDISDIIFAAYSDFPNTSNIMTKAALLRRPVLVSEGCLMADLTREYRLGEVVPQGDVDSIVRALQMMISDSYLAQAQENGCWHEYSQKHSADCLNSALQELLSE